MRLSEGFTTASYPGNIVDWAYDNTAGTAVLASITAVPEPAASLTGLALLTAAALRRRRQVERRRRRIGR